MPGPGTCKSLTNLGRVEINRIKHNHFGESLVDRKCILERTCRRMRHGDANTYLVRVSMHLYVHTGPYLIRYTVP